MYALRRIFIAVVLFCLLGFGATVAAISMTAHWSGVRDADRLLGSLGILASFVFAVGYLVAPLFRRGQQNTSDERPWRLLLVVLGAVLIVLLAAFLLQLFDLGLVGGQLAPAARGSKPFESIYLLDVVWTSLSLIAALIYLRYPFPRRLRRNSG